MRVFRTCSLLASALLWITAAPASASGGDGYQSNRFASEFRPADLNIFSAGNLGVLPGTYWRVYHYMAYQAAKGRPLTREQVAALSLDSWHVGHTSAFDSGDGDTYGAGAWQVARAPYAKQWKLPEDVKIEVMAQSGDHENYVNCHADAFKQAGATMNARARLGEDGKPDVWFKLWLQGQDAVFSNCEEPPHAFGKPLPKRAAQLPPPLPAGAPDWLKYDHAYQRAAADFYARNVDLARAQFLEIARQPKSPWQALAPYLAARALIRKATLDFPLAADQPPARERTEALALAKKELDAIAAAYVPAKQMLSLVEARISPTERIAALARALDKEPFGPGTPRMLSDYLILLDKAPRSATLAAREPLTAWIASMQADLPTMVWDPRTSEELQQQRVAAIDGLRKSWLKQADPIWLAPLLTLAHAGELSASEKKAAAALPAAHPLYQTVQYHLARLAIAEQQAASADKDIDRLMATYGKQMSVATTNRFLALKMLSAGTVEAFLKAAPRKVDLVEQGEAIDAPARKDAAVETDDDFGLSVWRHLPMAELKTLLKHPLLPAGWKPKLQETMLARALIFNDEATALELLDAVGKPRKTTAHLYERYRKAASGAERKIAGAVILVNTPELQPSVVDKRGASRYWGCGRSSTESPGLDLPMVPAPRYLSQERLAAAAKEQDILLRLPLRTEFLAPTLLEWAGKKQADEEAPKALHFLVAATRMECPHGAIPENEQLRARYSRQAYEMLHRLYPKSGWTKDTKYYY